MDWHCINFKRGGSQESEAADLVLALEDAYGSAGEPAAAEVFLARGRSATTRSTCRPRRPAWRQACCNVSMRSCAIRRPTCIAARRCGSDQGCREPQARVRAAVNTARSRGF